MEIVLAAFAGQAICLVMVLFVAKGLTARLLARDLDDHKEHLRIYAERELSELKKSIRRAAVENHTRATFLQQKRAEVIAESYGHLSELERAIQGFIPLADAASDDPSTQGRYRQGMQSVVEFFWFFDKSRILLKKETAEHLGKFAETLRNATLEVASCLQEADSALRKERADASRRLLSEAGEQAHALRSAIEHEFGKMFAVQAAPLSEREAG